MEYLILIASDENANPPRGTAEFDDWMRGFGRFNEELTAGGHLICGAGLQPTATATTVQKTAGSPSRVIDGPFAETKEQLGGFYVVAADNLDVVLALVEHLPIPTGSLEIRPLTQRV
jgi:hypothetical protein